MVEGVGQAMRDGRAAVAPIAFCVPSQAAIFRRSVPARVGAYVAFLVTCAGLSYSGVAVLPLPHIALLTLVECLVLAAVYQRALASRRWATAYLIFEALVQTAILHWIGNLRLAAVPFIYAMQMVNPGLRLWRRGYFIAANGMALLFFALVRA
ncbi:MAG TPA: hypothetical protein VGC36_14280, partial [Rhizomicrobium sp.]